MLFARKLTIVLLLAFLSSCTGIPEGIKAVDNFDVTRFLGTWYEVARLDHSFERGLASVTASYSLREDGKIEVTNKGYNTEEKKWEQVTGKAYLVDKANIGRLKVSFFGPFYGGYNIFVLDSVKYQYALICGSSRSSLWLLARTPTLDKTIVQQLVEQARQLGFKTETLIYVDHSIQP